MQILLLFYIFCVNLVDSCLVVHSKTDSVTVPNCLCPPIQLLDQEGVKGNIGGRYLGNRQTWRPTIGFNLDVTCEFNVFCPAVPGVSSFFTILLRDHANPIFINRVIDNQSTFVPQPRSIGDLECKVYNGEYQWHFHSYPVFGLSFACQADVDSCNCPEIPIDNHGLPDTYVTQQIYPVAPDQCSLFMAFPVFGGPQDQFPLIYSTSTPIFVGDHGNTFFEDLMCIKGDENQFNWYFYNEKLENVSVGWSSLRDTFGSNATCECGVFGVIKGTLELNQYDKKGLYKGAIIGAMSWEPSCTFVMKCDEGFESVVFSDNESPITVLPTNGVTCTYNPLSNFLKMWVVNGIRVVNPAGGCLKFISDNTVPLPGCNCAPVQLVDQTDVKTNEGGSYLGNRQTWLPEIGYDGRYPCWLEVYCPAVPGVSSFYSVLLRGNGSPVYINRVINNQSTFRPQPRSIGDFKCDIDADGTYQWFFHNYSLTDLSFTCQADVESCNCPEIKISSGATVEPRFPGAPNQCSLYQAKCDDVDQWPFLYSKDSVINDGALWDTFYDDLTCIKDDENNYDWYFFNQKLENLTIGCNTVLDEFGSPEVCVCGAFPIINSPEKLTRYDTTSLYSGATIGVNSWEPSCKFFMNCDEGFTGVVFSSNNVPIELSGNYITCIYNPLSNDLRMWVVNSVRVLNPAGACLKKN